MKKSTVFTALLLLICLFSLASCSKDGRVDEETFKSSTDVSDDNVTIFLTYAENGFEYKETVKIVEGVAYVKLEFSDDWFDVKAENYLDALVAMADCYSEFKYKKGSYTASEISTTDALGETIVYKSVSLTFDKDGRLESAYYEVEDGTSVISYSYSFENYGFSVEP